MSSEKENGELAASLYEAHVSSGFEFPDLSEAPVDNTFEIPDSHPDIDVNSGTDGPSDTGGDGNGGTD